MTVNATVFVPSYRAGGSDILHFAPIIERPLQHHKLGLSYTATGYGSKLPTRFMLRYNGRLYRVYSSCFSNVSREYIVVNGQQYGVQL